VKWTCVRTEAGEIERREHRGDKTVECGEQMELSVEKLTMMEKWKSLILFHSVNLSTIRSA